MMSLNYHIEFDHIEHILKKYKTLSANLSIHICINMINRIVFKIKDQTKLELQTILTMELCGSTKKSINKRKNGENVSSFEGVEIVLVQHNFVDNQYQQKSVLL